MTGGQAVEDLAVPALKKTLRKAVKSCGTQAQLTGGQAVADRAVPALKKTLSFFRSSRSLPLTLFCRLSREVNENIFCP